ncbi:class I SAM-dependent methyltransferase [Sedimentitalea todarodis]|uniref:Class I SAM-dependent methyltransferase n=1 Tax=Sedimentitalea todarodis TaxID=1631240 RepID=A0ABU3VE01_9RHOB|nr:class I SAM-dependent methyltransferase [Sedimentitalea todarodis]MDU9004318.1 class I SAM-dependent methyltransferase [Sedimentitalea todarodis]
MTRVLTARTVNGIACYSPDVAESYADYPDAAFEVTDAEVERSFWVRSRNRLFGWLVQQDVTRLGRANLLDIGCGTGSFLGKIIDMPGLSATGSEIYLSGLKIAQKRQPRAEFIQFDVTQGVLDRQFDIITAFDVLEHVEQDEAGFRNIHDMLSDDGTYIMSVPQHAFLWSRLDEIVHHKRRYSRADLLTKLIAVGFEPQRVTSQVFFLFPLVVVSRLLDRSISGAAPTDDAQALLARVSFPRPVNWLFDKIMRLDEALIRMGLSLPFGSTLIVVARKSGA